MVVGGAVTERVCVGVCVCVSVCVCVCGAYISDPLIKSIL